MQHPRSRQWSITGVSAVQRSESWIKGICPAPATMGHHAPPGKRLGATRRCGWLCCRTPGRTRKGQGAGRQPTAVLSLTERSTASM